MNIELDLIKDFEHFMLVDIDNLKDVGFEFINIEDWKKGRTDKESTEDKFKNELIYNYANLRRRLVEPKPRKILYSKHFERPSDYEEGLKLLENKIKKGESLIPHLSRQIFKTNEQDGMLFDFGIYHLHLGTTPDSKKPYLIQGRENILYCLFDNYNAYFLEIDKHGRWNDLDLLRIIKDNFPNKIETWRMEGVVGLAFNPTEAERLSLRKAGINTPIELDGKFYISPGGGINSAGTSACAVMEMDRCYDRAEYIEKIIKNYFKDNSEIESKLKTNSLNLSLDSFTPFKLSDNKKGVIVELEFNDDNTVTINVSRKFKS